MDQDSSPWSAVAMWPWVSYLTALSLCIIIFFIFIFLVIQAHVFTHHPYDDAKIYVSNASLASKAKHIQNGAQNISPISARPFLFLIPLTGISIIPADQA